ncbi:hypothetical protein [Archangium lipolyticum]|nr:hypothetical protein [Archangium lipolyticum]
MRDSRLLALTVALLAGCVTRQVSKIPLLDDAREAALKEPRQLFPGMR